MKRRTALWLVLTLGTLGGATACEEKDAGDHLEEAVEEAGEGVEDAVDEAGDAIEDATDRN